MPSISFRRDSNVTNLNPPISDGQIIFDTTTHKILMDNGNTRLQYGGTTDLITSPVEALETNAFNSVSALNIFTQKSTTVDTKSNALAVTQPYIPLGCLAFKEMLGSNNYSEIADGTVSGGLVRFNNQLTANGYSVYMDYQNGHYGINTSANRGADTFIPFRREPIFVAKSATGYLPPGAWGLSVVFDFSEYPYIEKVCAMHGTWKQDGYDTRYIVMMGNSSNNNLSLSWYVGDCDHQNVGGGTVQSIVFDPNTKKLTISIGQHNNYEDITISHTFSGTFILA